MPAAEQFSLGAALLVAVCIAVAVAACGDECPKCMVTLHKPDACGNAEPKQVCNPDDNDYCQNQGGHKVCASVDTSICCKGLCRYVLAITGTCVCVEGTQLACSSGGKKGTQTCLDASKNGVEGTRWDACEVPADPPPVITYFHDADGDSYCGEARQATSPPASDWKTICTMEPPQCDRDPRAHTITTEVCGDGIDNDCRGGDLACPPPPKQTYYRDADGDSYCGESQEATSPPGPGWVTSCRTEPAQCENNAAVHAIKPEICGDGIDNDCYGGDETDCPPERCCCGNGFCPRGVLLGSPGCNRICAQNGG